MTTDGGRLMTKRGSLTHAVNSLGQLVGAALPDWRPPSLPPREPMTGRYCKVEPLDVEHHAEALYAAVSLDREGRNWTYVPSGPFDDFAAYLAWLEQRAAGTDPMFHAILGSTGKAIGTVRYVERTIVRRRTALRVFVRGRVPPVQRGQGAHPRFCVVLRSGQRVAGVARGVRALACS